MDYKVYRHQDKELVKEFIEKNRLYPNPSIDYMGKGFLTSDCLKAMRILARMRDISIEEGVGFVAYFVTNEGVRYFVTNVEPWG